MGIPLLLLCVTGWVGFIGMLVFCRKYQRLNREALDGWRDALDECRDMQGAIKRQAAEIERLKQKDSADWWKEER